VYYCSKQQCKELAKALKYAYYYASDVNRAEQLEQ
jgi:hypothetical protein